MNIYGGKNGGLMNKIKKHSIVVFFGRQLSRLRLGQSYYQLVIATISAISLVSLAFEVTLVMLLLLFPIVFIGSFMLGWGLDRWNISAIDYRKTTEITGRFVNALDLKNLDMRFIMTEGIIRAQQDKDFDMDKFLEEEKAKFVKKWSPK